MENHLVQELLMLLLLLGPW